MACPRIVRGGCVEAGDRAGVETALSRAAAAASIRACGRRMFRVARRRGSVIVRSRGIRIEEYQAMNFHLRELPRATGAT
ncbi:MAG: hypothetical protein IPO20_22785 [Gammaproteobacteria bacterium]|nr:hypothetical protein [Gammaproteobacteria bacterium]MBP7910330.1 hypothetical protein [Pseudomonadales bacterium]